MATASRRSWGDAGSVLRGVRPRAFLHATAVHARCACGQRLDENSPRRRGGCEARLWERDAITSSRLSPRCTGGLLPVGRARHNGRWRFEWRLIPGCASECPTIGFPAIIAECANTDCRHSAGCVLGRRAKSLDVRSRSMMTRCGRRPDGCARADATLEHAAGQARRVARSIHQVQAIVAVRSPHHAQTGRAFLPQHRRSRCADASPRCRSSA